MHRSIPTTPSASATRGAWFVFHHAGHHFGLWASALTGKEELYVDGELVSEQTKVALSSVHTVDVGGASYAVELSVRKLRRGLLHCVLRENGIAVSALETEYVMHRKWRPRAATIAAAALVMCVAVALGVSLLVAALGVAAACLLSYPWLGGAFVVRSIEPPLGAPR